MTHERLQTFMQTSSFSVPDNIDIKTPIGFINVNSIGNGNIEIICISENTIVKYSFSSFLGLENRSEFFDRKPGVNYNLKTLPESNAFFPISYIIFEDFKNNLSDYELTMCNDKTKLWRFLSLTNFIELYSNVEPIREIKMNSK